IRSRITISGPHSVAERSPTTPSSHACTSNPSERKLYRKASLRLLSSSIIRIFFLVTVFLTG
ncbi:MAG: hypothetical protein QF908_01915, partial [Dehalococcoidia bacterium]|nr:hypothetical protein [Dehalococcoidia bacterium]